VCEFDCFACGGCRVSASLLFFPERAILNAYFDFKNGIFINKTDKTK
jgi:hypothetical protein